MHLLSEKIHNVENANQSFSEEIQNTEKLSLFTISFMEKYKTLKNTKHLRFTKIRNIQKHKINLIVKQVAFKHTFHPWQWSFAGVELPKFDLEEIARMCPHC